MKIVITARDFSTDNAKGLGLLMDVGFETVDYSALQLGSGTKEETVYKLVKDADAVITGLEPYTDWVLSQCPRLKIISRRGIGYDSVDIKSCKEKGIAVTRTAGVVEGAVAEHIIAYILYFARQVHLQNHWMQQGQWKRIMVPGAKGRTLGLVGFGGIGKEVAVRAAALGMNILYYCRHPKKSDELRYGVTYVPLSELLAKSDYVSVNVPLTEQTRGMFDLKTLEQMKQGSYFLNTARGAVVDANALKTVLKGHHLAGAAVDVFEEEPCTDSPLHHLSNAVLTPHTAPYTEENFREMNRMAAKNVVDYFAGKLPEKNRVV